MTQRAGNAHRAVVKAGWDGKRWVAKCETCGWTSRDFPTMQQAAADADWHETQASH